MVTKVRRKYVVDEKGKPVSVLLDIRSYRKMLEELEELEAIHAFDAAKSSPDEVIPFEQAMREIKLQHRKLPADMADHLLIEKAKRVKGTPITLDDYARR